jgi:hypothetical protein
MQCTNTDDTENTDGLLLVDKAQGDNCVYFLSRCKLSDPSGWRSCAIGRRRLTYLSGISNVCDVRRQGTSFHLDDYYMATITGSSYQILDQGEWGNTHLSVCTWFFLTFGRVRKNCEKRLLASSCPSVCPQGTTWLPLDGFSRNLVSEYFSKICRKNSSLIKIWQK